MPLVEKCRLYSFVNRMITEQIPQDSIQNKNLLPYSFPSMFTNVNPKIETIDITNNKVNTLCFILMAFSLLFKILPNHINHAPYRAEPMFQGNGKPIFDMANATINIPHIKRLYLCFL